MSPGMPPEEELRKWRQGQSRKEAAEKAEHLKKWKATQTGRGKKMSQAGQVVGGGYQQHLLPGWCGAPLDGACLTSDVSPETAAYCARAVLQHMLDNFVVELDAYEVTGLHSKDNWTWSDFPEQYRWVSAGTKVYWGPWLSAVDEPSPLEFYVAILVVPVGGEYSSLTWQCFERRKLTVIGSKDGGPSDSSACVDLYKTACKLAAPGWWWHHDYDNFPSENYYAFLKTAQDAGGGFVVPSQYSLSEHTGEEFQWCHPDNFVGGMGPEAYCPEIEQLTRGSRAAYCSCALLNSAIWQGEDPMWEPICDHFPGASFPSPGVAGLGVANDHKMKVFVPPSCEFVLEVAEAKFNQGNAEAPFYERWYLAPLPDFGAVIEWNDDFVLPNGVFWTGTQITKAAKVRGYLTAIMVSLRRNRFTELCDFEESASEYEGVCSDYKYESMWSSDPVPLFFGNSEEPEKWADALAKYQKLCWLLPRLHWTGGKYEDLDSWIRNPHHLPLVSFVAILCGNTDKDVLMYKDGPSAEC